MLKQKSQRPLSLATGKHLPVALLACFTLATVTSCNSFFHSNKKQTLKTESGETIDLNDATVKKYVGEWHDAKPQIDRLGKLETDLNFLLSEVSKMSDLGQAPGLASNQTTTTNSNKTAVINTTSPVVSAPSPIVNPVAPSGKSVTGTAPGTTNTYLTAPIPTQPQVIESPSMGAGGSLNIGGADFNPSNAFCSEPFANSYIKTLAIANFPRVLVNSSKFGQLAQVEQHLPLLIGANLRNRHSLLVPAYIPGAVANANTQGEPATAAQAIRLANQNRVQFTVTGEVDDMSLYSPGDAQNPSYFRKLMNGTIDAFSIDTKYDKRGRVFSFTLQVRDGITGQLVFNNQYKTVGQWNAPANVDVGFASPQFWQTDYGRKIQQLVAHASDDLANSIRCQAYISRVDARPFQQQVVIQSGTNNGLRSGDSFELYQLVYQPVTGEYQQFNTRLIKRNGRVYLTEIYPSHSVGQVVNDTLSGGQYIVKAQ
jgi:hypothetical protein